MARIKRTSPLGREPGWGLTALISKASSSSSSSSTNLLPYLLPTYYQLTTYVLISKANDDVRQEAFVMQATLCRTCNPMRCSLQPHAMLPAALCGAPCSPMRSILQPYVVQAIRLLYDAMPAPLWLRPYHILSTGPRSGLIEMVS